MGFKKIGEGLVSETALFIILDKKFHYTFNIKHYRNKILEGLEIDYYLPELKIGIEYQGKQHFEPIDFFGGVEKYEKQVERDIRKKELCQKNGIKLIYINYFDVLDEKEVNRVVDQQLESPNS